MKKFLSLLVVSCISVFIFPQPIPSKVLSSHAFCPAEIKKFMSFYPDLEYSALFDIEMNDWKIEVSGDLFFERTAKPKSKKSAVFYWADGKMLPKSELANKDKYWILQYTYNNVLKDPKTLTLDRQVLKVDPNGTKTFSYKVTPTDATINWVYSSAIDGVQNTLPIRIS